MTAEFALSARKEMSLAILPFPSAILSVLGSSTIIYMAYKSRRKRNFSPYTRLLVAMSACDILLSTNLSIATFARPKETSPRMYSMGNSATCKTVGFLNQATFATIFYQSMLSCYFVLTARFGVSNKYIATKVEPWMHIVSIGYPLLTALVTLGKGAYGESSTMLGCWLDCPEESWGRKECHSMIMMYLWLGIPVILAFTALAVNHMLILSFVRRQMPREKNQPLSLHANNVQRQYTEVVTSIDVGRSQLEDNDDAKSKEQTTQQPSNGGVSQSDHCQERRRKLVSSQAFLFVASFLLCNVWTAAGAKSESIGTEKTDMKLLVQLYPILACQAFFAPLQGFLNMLVYIRPRYLTIRQQYPHQSRQWVVRTAIFGEEQKLAPPRDEGENHPVHYTRVQQQGRTLLPCGVMDSSLTASEGDFDHITLSDDRWKESSCDKTHSIPTISLRFHSEARLSTLEVISELEESDFQTPKTTALSINIETRVSDDKRWTNSERSLDSFSPSCPKREGGSELEWIARPVDPLSTSNREEGSELELIARPIYPSNRTDGIGTSKDTPMRIPTRRSSLEFP